MNFSRITSVITLLLMISFSSHASHIIGGEVSYTCLGGDDYQITMKVYRDCYNGQAPFDNPASLTIYDGNGLLYLVAESALLSDDTIEQLPPDSCSVVPYYVCTEIGTYQFTVNLPASSVGYSLVYQRCCRSFILSNLVDASNAGSTYCASIPSDSLAPCNNSPYSNTPITPYLCVNEPALIDGSVTESDGDSLVYELCAPYGYDDPFNPYPIPANPPPYSNVNYVSPFSGTNPLPANPAFSINTQTGEVTGTPTAIGTYAMGICVSEYRDGNLLDVFRRDFVVTVTDCGIAGVLFSSINTCSLEVNFNVLNNNGAYDYSWDFGDLNTNADTSSFSDPTYTYPATGDYTATVIATSSSCADTVPISVHIISPNADFTYSNAFPNEPMNFYDQSQPSYGNVIEWHWSFGDGGSSSDQNPVHIYFSSGTYSVRLIIVTSQYCQDTIIKEVPVYGTAAIPLLTDKNLIVYPNPVHDKLYVQFPKGYELQLVQIEIYDALGTKVFSQEENNIHEITGLNIPVLQSGCYWLKISSEKSSFKRKLIFVD